MRSDVIEVEVTPGGSVAGVWLGDVLYPFVQAECGPNRASWLRKIYKYKTEGVTTVSRYRDFHTLETKPGMFETVTYQMPGARISACIPAPDLVAEVVRPSAMTIINRTIETNREIAMNEKCARGCDWEDHDKDGHCYKQCERCPIRCNTSTRPIESETPTKAYRYDGV